MRTFNTVSQVFTIFGDPATEKFDRLSDAEKYADQLAMDIAKMVAEGNATLTDDDRLDGTGMSNEVEWEKENWRETNIERLYQSIRKKAIEIVREEDI